MSDEQAKKKEELLRLLSQVDPEAARIAAIGKELIQAASLSRDVAAPMREIVTQLPNNALPPAQLDRSIKGWQEWHDNANQVLTLETTADKFGVMSSGVTNTTAVMLSVMVPPLGGWPQPIQIAKEQFYRTLERNTLAEQARASMIRLGLDSRGGTYRTALELLDEATATINQPVTDEGGPTSVLMPLRESIDASITELIRRRPVQAKVSGWRGKVLSLGQQCARFGLSMAYFERLGDDVELLWDQLSSAKQQGMSRERMSEIFHAGVSFLHTLLSSIDEKLLKA
jgi:hypothetical protein